MLTILGEHQNCDVLINCCGNSIPAKFQDLSQNDIKFMMDINFFSAVNLTRLVLPSMKARSLKNRKSEARIVFVSSMCGLLSFYGYSAYAASKFALVGLAEALNMELLPFKIGVTVAFPGDTSTPGYEAENRAKPYLTKKISESGKVYSADSVAGSIIIDINSGRFYSSFGVENLAVLSALNAFMPDTAFNAVVYSMIATPLRIMSYFILKNWYSLVENRKEEERSL